MVTWETVDEPSVKPTLVKRAKKRKGFPLSDSEWVVLGDTKLNDNYDEYRVRLEDGEYRCSCQEHAGGQYRKRCSHMVFVLLAKAGKTEWGIEREVQPSSQQAELPDIQEVPIFVEPTEEQKLDSVHTAQRRQALDDFFGIEPPLPEWVTYLRQQQWDALLEIDANFKAGKRIQFLEAPTGTGKTLIAEIVRRYISSKKTIYTCMTRSLQEQQARDFPYANIIWGKSNYPTADAPNNKALNAGLCTKVWEEGTIQKPCCPVPQQNTHCAYCHPTSACPYEVAKNRASFGQLAVANLAYLLNEWKAPKSRFMMWNLLIVDEADELENQLMSHVEVTITENMRKELGITTMPERKTVGKYRDGPEEWERWIKMEAMPAITKLLRSMPDPDVQTQKQRRTYIRYERLYRTMQLVADEITSEDEGGWVYTGYKEGNVTFKPVKISHFAKDMLFNNAGRIICMSATFVSAELTARDLGLEDDEWAFVGVGSGFPKERRPIYVERAANVINKTIDTEWPILIDRIAEICKERSDEKILIHTVSYKLNKMVKDGLERRGIPRHKLFTYYDASYRETALRKFRDASSGVLMAPSFERGIDLKGDECRVVIIAKVPFPYLGDQQIQARMHTKGGQDWYAMLTVRSIVQMTGRAMRSKEDWCETFILDKQFNDNIFSRHKRLLPPWWKEAIVPYKKGRKKLEQAIQIASTPEEEVNTQAISW